MVLAERFLEALKVVRHIEMPKDKSILVQAFVYVLLFNLFIFGQTIDVSLVKL